MALYASMTQETFEAIAAAFDLGEVKQTRGIPQGSINTNAVLTTDKGRFFVRHTQVRQASDLQFEAALLAHLHEAHFPAPTLLRTKGGEPFVPLAGGLVSVFGYLAGEELSRSSLTTEHLEQLGAELGKMHRVLSSFGGERENPYGAATVGRWVDELMKHEQAELREAAAQLLGALSQFEAHSEGLLPLGVIHADLFVDNVKWVGDRVAAIFDFEMACRGPLVLDLAIALNAWCFEGHYDQALGRALVRGYARERPMAEQERTALWRYALFGAVRFTASRIRDFHLSPLPPERLAKKDYRTYLARVGELTAIGPKRFTSMFGL